MIFGFVILQRNDKVIYSYRRTTYEKNTHVSLIAAAVLGIAALVLIGATLYRNTPAEIQTNYYSFICPRTITATTCGSIAMD